MLQIRNVDKAVDPNFTSLLKGTRLEGWTANPTTLVDGTVGIQLDDLQRMERIISVAGGASKADAIAAFCAVACRDTLITDEGAARAILASES